MAKNTIKPRSSYGDKGTGGGCHTNTPVKGQMKLGKGSTLSSRAGTFKGTAYDVREKGGGKTRFSKGIPGPAGYRPEGHAKQGKGHSGWVKGMKHG